MTKNSEPKELALAMLPLPFRERQDQGFDHLLKSSAKQVCQEKDEWLLLICSNIWASGQFQECLIVGFFLSSTSFKTQSSVLWNSGQSDTYTILDVQRTWLCACWAPDSGSPPHFISLNKDEQAILCHSVKSHVDLLCDHRRDLLRSFEQWNTFEEICWPACGTGL